MVEGHGRTVVDGKAFDWATNDILALPSWAAHHHENTGREDAVLFSIDDRPVMQKLDLYREQPVD